ncbi:putative UDP-glycosyltransferase 84A1 [Hypsibius exemplaris]|uniref:UDP-glucuronosyltransferase n=1 Tax=Hypsibius exemplaris TaxID=2072580 RepID=A0A9X6NIS0_HYPEX|nr:putative UDP-glycosyltransferase 84A1 [Hypsibius exemplaris]
MKEDFQCSAHGTRHPLLHLGLKLTHFHNVTFAVSQPVLTGLQNEAKNCRHGQYGPIKFVEVTSEEAIHGAIKTVTDPSEFKDRFKEIYSSMRGFLATVPSAKATRKPAASHPGITGDVDLVIVENLLGPVPYVLHERGIPYYLFNSMRTFLAQIFLTIDIDEPADFEPLSHVNRSFYRPSVGHKMLDPFLEAIKDVVVEHCAEANHSSKGLIINSLREAETEGVAELLALPHMQKMRTFCVGPLIPDFQEQSSTTEPSKGEEVLKWLDSQDTESVTYISFGSMAQPSPDEIVEIAGALLATNGPFIWSLQAEHHIHLPPGIQEGTRNHKFLVVSWAPQKRILSHPATKLFFSHCGWNSTQEALASGTPMVCWPMFADQLMNAEWLEREGVGKLITGTGIAANRLVPACEIAGLLAFVADKTNGHKEAAKVWQAKIQTALAVGGSSTAEFENLVQSLEV